MDRPKWYLVFMPKTKTKEPSKKGRRRRSDRRDLAKCSRRTTEPEDLSRAAASAYPDEIVGRSCSF